MANDVSEGVRIMKTWKSDKSGEILTKDNLKLEWYHDLSEDEHDLSKQRGFKIVDRMESCYNEEVMYKQKQSYSDRDLDGDRSFNSLLEDLLEESDEAGKAELKVILSRLNNGD